MSHECVLSTSKLVGLSVAASGKSVLSCTIRLLVLGTFDVIKLNELGWFYSNVDTMSILLLEKKKKKSCLVIGHFKKINGEMKLQLYSGHE